MRIYQLSVQALLEEGLQELLASRLDFTALKRLLTDREPIQAMTDYVHETLLVKEQLDKDDSRAELCNGFYHQQVAKDESCERQDSLEAQRDIVTAESLPSEMSQLSVKLSAYQLQLEVERQKLSQASCQLACLNQQLRRHSSMHATKQRELNSVEQDLRSNQQVVVVEDCHSEIPGVVVKSPLVQQLEAQKHQLSLELSQMSTVITDCKRQIRLQKDIEHRASQSHQHLIRQIQVSETRLKEHDVMLHITLPERANRRHQRQDRRALRALSRKGFALDANPSQAQIETTLDSTLAERLSESIRTAHNDLHKKRLQLEQEVKESSYQYFFDAFETFQSQLKMKGHEREAILSIYRTMQEYLSAQTDLQETNDQILLLNGLIRGSQQRKSSKESRLQCLREKKPELENTIRQLKRFADDEYRLSEREFAHTKKSFSACVIIGVVIGILFLAHPPALVGLSIGLGAVGGLFLLITLGLAIASFQLKRKACSHEHQAGEAESQLAEQTGEAKQLEEDDIPAINQQLADLAIERQAAEAKRDQQETTCKRLLAKADSITPSRLSVSRAVSPVTTVEPIRPSAPPYTDDELPSYQSAMAM